MEQDVKQIAWGELVEGDEGESLLDRWVAGRIDEEEDRAVAAHLLGSTFARDEAQLRLAIHRGVAQAALRSPIRDGLKIAVRAVLGMLEVLGAGLPALTPRVVPVRASEVARSTAHSFSLDGVTPGAVLHIRTARGDRFALDLETGGAPGSDAEWILAGPGGRLVAAEGQNALVFPSVAPGTWTLHRADGVTRSAAVQLHLLVEE